MSFKKYLPIIGLILFIYLIIKVDFFEIVKEIKNANIFFISVSIILTIMILIIQTFKWYIIAVFQGINFSFIEAFKINLISNFYGFVTPSRLGTVMRAEYLKKYTNNIGKGLCNFTLDKILDSASLIFIAIVFSFVFSQRIKIPINFFIVIFIGLGVTTLFFINKNRSKFVLKFFYKRIIPVKYKEKAKLTFDSFYDNIPKKRYFFFFFLLNLINWMMLYWINYIIGLSLGINLPFIYFLAIMPIGTLIALIPISISGLGTREATLISLFGLFGISASKVFSMSLISFFIIGIIPAIIGGVLGWKSSFEKKEKNN